MVLSETNTFMFGGLGVGLGIGFLISYLAIGTSLRRDMRKRIAKIHDEFTDLASHYLLNPIAIIQTAVSQLQERENQLTSDERLKLYEAIQRGQQRLWITTEQLVLVSDLRRNRLELSFTVGQPADVVTGAMATVAVFAKQKDIHLEFHGLPPGVQNETRIDNRRLKQAVIAILDNAIKFTPEGGTVQVALQLDSSTNIWSIIIEDGGIGMSSEVQSHLAEQFYRGTSLYNFDYEGMGLGLYIAQSIVHLHQGNILANSKPKKGTTITIQFPSL